MSKRFLPRAIAFGLALFAAPAVASAQNVRPAGGTTLPAACTSNDVYVKTDAATGGKLYLCVSGAWEQQGGGGSALTVKEIDGSPTASSVSTIRFSNGSLTDDGGGQVSVTVTGGSGTPGGSNTQLQYNNAGNFGGVSGCTSSGTNLVCTGGSLRATNPGITGYLADSNGAGFLDVTATSSAVNRFGITNATSGNAPVFAAVGGDANIAIRFLAKGTGTYDSGDCTTNCLTHNSAAVTGSKTATWQNASGTVPIIIASGAKALATSAISSAACSAAQTATATGALSTDTVLASFNGDPTAVTGYVPLTSGMLTIIPYPTADTVNFKVCNNTGSSITPGAITLNWRIVR